METPHKWKPPCDNFLSGPFVTGDQNIGNIDPAGLPGFLPASGNVISIDYNGGMLAILIGLAGAHQILLLIGIWASNKIIVIEDEYLAIALLSSPVFSEYSGRGALLGSEERERIGEETSVVYGLTRADSDRSSVIPCILDQYGFLSIRIRTIRR
jgi:hypothetical protein